MRVRLFHSLPSKKTPKAGSNPKGVSKLSVTYGQLFLIRKTEL